MISVNRGPTNSLLLSFGANANRAFLRGAAFADDAPGMMDTLTCLSADRRRMIRGASRVQRPLWVGKLIPVKPSSRDDFPLD